jgi:hypothetical protein
MSATKKQKNSDYSANSYDSVRSIRTQASPQLPGEVLQTIFRNLPFLDLLRCMRVCKVWRACLPGDDPFLNETLFSRSRRMRAEPLKLEFELYVFGSVTRIPDGELPKIRYFLQIRRLYRKGANLTCLHPIGRNPHCYSDLFNKNVMDFAR